MSIDSCSKCGDLINTDYFPEVYREELNDACICDGCYQSLPELNMWTTDKPTIDGWYWFRDPDAPSEYWPVEIEAGVIWEDGICVDYDIRGEYQGPIKPESNRQWTPEQRAALESMQEAKIELNKIALIPY